MFFFRLHRWLALEGNTQAVGKHLVALSTIAAILLSIGGVIVYYPRIKRGFTKSLKLNSNCKGRAYLSNLHSVFGMWTLPFMLIMSLTGLYWSYDWYREALFSIAGVEMQKRVAPPKSNHSSINYNEIQKTVEIFELNAPNDFKSATLKVVPSGSKYSVTYLLNDATHFRESNTMLIDSSGVLKHNLYANKKMGEKFIASMLALHSGEFFGFIGRFVWFVSSLAMGFFAATGYILYYKRYKATSSKSTIQMAVSCS